MGAGLVLAGAAQYGFLAIAAHALGPVRYAPLATFYSLLFVSGPGFFFPLEQELGRAVSARRTLGLGSRPLILRAAAAGATVVVLLCAGVLLASGPIADRLFQGQSLLVWALVAGLVAYCLEHLSRGTLAGNGRFGAYGLLLGSEGVLRVLFCTLLAVAGTLAAGVFGFALVAASYLAIALALAGRRGLLEPGPPAAWRELSRALTYLLVSSVFTQFLLSIGTVAVQLLAKPTQQAAAGQFLTARVLAYIPIYLLQAVQAALLPRLAALATGGRDAELRHELRQLLVLVAVLGAVATAAFGLLGPLAARLFFGNGFELGHLDYVLLGGSCAVFMLAQVLNQALVALAGYPRATVAWTAGAAVFVAATLLGSQLFLRVEVGLLVGAVVTVMIMATLLRPLLRRTPPQRSADELVADELVQEIQPG